MDADPVGSDGRGAEPLLTGPRAGHASATAPTAECQSAALATAPVIALTEVGSTNDEAMARLRQGGAPVWVVAERQLAGRGRRARPWVSERGNLYASVAFPSGLNGAAFGMLPLAAAVALADAIALLGVETHLKWPNDVLVDGRKVSGILIETEMAGTDRRVVVGYGVNVAQHPQDLPATHLAAHRDGLTPSAVLDTLAPAFAQTLRALEAPDGVATVRQRWLDRAAGIGGPIEVRLERQTLSGAFEGLDAEGRLVLRAPDGGQQHIVAGDVFLRAAS